MTVLLGVDVGGSGIKGAPVDVETGRLSAKRRRIATPVPSTPEAVAGVVAAIAAHFDWNGPIGCGLPVPVKSGIALTAANIDRLWVGADAVEVLGQATGERVEVINDADAAGLAEMRHGAGHGHLGTVLLLTFGTGIGSALFVEGRLVPNTELGHLEFHAMEAEHYAASRLVEHEGLPFDEWVRRVDGYLKHVAMLFSPDLIIFGGGISKRFDLFAEGLSSGVPVVPAELRNNAGIVGAAIAAHEAREEGNGG